MSDVNPEVPTPARPASTPVEADPSGHDTGVATAAAEATGSTADGESVERSPDAPGPYRPAPPAPKSVPAALWAPVRGAWFLVERIFGEPRRRVDAEANGGDAPPPDSGMYAAYVVAALALTLMDYIASPRRIEAVWQTLDTLGLHRAACSLEAAMSVVGVPRQCFLVANGDLAIKAFEPWDGAPIVRLTVWAAAWAIVGFGGTLLLAGPAVRMRMARFGLAAAPVRTIAALVAAVLVPVGALHLAGGVATVPMAFGDRVAAMQVAQPATVVAGLVIIASSEVVFRGLMVMGGRRTFGIHAALVGAIPWAMWFYGTDLTTTLAAWVSGVALGWLALRAGTIWLGVAVLGATAAFVDISVEYHAIVAVAAVALGVLVPAATAAARDRLELRTSVVLGTVMVSLALLEYVGMSNRYTELVGLIDALGLGDLACSVDAWLSPTGFAEVCAGAADIPRGSINENLEIRRLTYWASACFTVYFILPAAVTLIVLRDSFGSMGLGARGALKDAWIYVAMFSVVAPLILLVSKDPHFQHTYPFYPIADGEPLWPNLWTWEALYFSQFFALEFFFRGFMVHGTRQRLGYGAVFAMMVPYCMIHFGKPMPETIGAVIAGVALGSLSLKARSVWLGVAIHASVALSMDFASLWQRGYFATH